MPKRIYSCIHQQFQWLYARLSSSQKEEQMI